MNRHVIKLATIGAVAMLMAGGAFAQNWSNSTAAQAASGTNMFGGPIYSGAPALSVTAALVKAGGGAENFSFPKALVSMLGEKTVNAEVAKLQKQYGKQEVHTFITGMTYAVKDGLKRATEAGVKLPAAPADLHGVALARTLVTAGTTSNGTWWAGYLFDHALSHNLHNRVMEDINANVSTQADMTTHKILNQAMFDVAHALGHTHVKLASLH
ncbi:MAG: hypothetical protein ACRESE_04230 [Gammaproteobacteria bacterium]